MAMGKAVVASQTGPGPEIIQPEVNGLLCDPFDPSSIAQAVTRALRDYQLRQRLGAAARKTVEEKYAVDVLLQKNLDFYRDCLEHRA
jgi:glycosyltransferase involved in cell wall biosynthesis